MTKVHLKSTRAFRVSVVIILVGLIAFAATSVAGKVPRYGSAPEAESIKVLYEHITADRASNGEGMLNAGYFESFLYPYTELVAEDTLKDLAYSGQSPTNFISQQLFLFGSLSTAEARQDVDLLFTAFKYSYCLYEYYGGDRVFEKAKEQLLNTIADVTSDGGNITKRKFRQLLLDSLSFVQDGHVFIAGKSLLRRHHFYFSEQMTFSRDVEGYYTVLQGDKYYVDQIILDIEDKHVRQESSGQASLIEDFIQLSLDKDGRLVYILGTITQHNQKRLPVRVILTGDGGTTEKQIVLKRKGEISFYRSITYKRDMKDNIPVVINRNTAPSTEKMRTDLDLFISEATIINQEDVAILDIRQHAGGQWNPALQWAEILAGQPITYEQHDGKLRTRTALTLKRHFVEWYLRDNEASRILSMNDIRSQLDRLQSFNPRDDAVWTIQHYLDTQLDLLPNDTLLFVLIDRDTGSAGEDFVLFLRQLENVIFVGENTKGVNISGEPAWGTLPNSGLSFQISLDMTLSSDWVEGVGYSPDIWVNPDVALDRVLSFIEQEVE